MWFRLRVRGIPVHVAQAQTGSNAILSAYALIQALPSTPGQLNRAARTHAWFGSAAPTRSSSTPA